MTLFYIRVHLIFKFFGLLNWQNCEQHSSKVQSALARHRVVKVGLMHHMVNYLLHVLSSSGVCLDCRAN